MARRIPQIDRSTAGGLLAICLWSTTIAASRSLSEKVGPLTAGVAVYLVGGVFCFLGLGRSRAAQILKLPSKYLVGCGFLFVLYSLLLYLAVGMARDHEQVIEIGLINYLWPALTIWFSLLLLNHRAGFSLLPGTGIALSGVLCVMTQNTHFSWVSFRDHLTGNPVAYCLALAAAVSWALYSNLARRWSGPGHDGAVALFIPATGLVLLAIRSFTPEATHWSISAGLEAGFLGAVTALAYALWESAMRKGNLLLVAVCSYATPLLSTAISCAYLKVTPSSKLWIGCLLIVAGSIVSWRAVSAREA